MALSSDFSCQDSTYRGRWWHRRAFSESPRPAFPPTAHPFRSRTPKSNLYNGDRNLDPQLSPTLGQVTILIDAHGPYTKAGRYAIHRLQTVDRFSAGNKCVGSSSGDSDPEEKSRYAEFQGIDTLIHAEDLVISWLFKIRVKRLSFDNISPQHPGLSGREIIPCVACRPIIPNHEITLRPTMRKGRLTLIDGIKQ